jgi:SAM-dependent methyltransferase
MAIEYDHARNVHSVLGPEKAMPIVFQYTGNPRSIIDVGCGMGTWLRAAILAGVSDVLGVDGVPMQSHQLLIPEALFLCRSLNEPVDVGRRFDCAICLEVGEHLDEEHTEVLMDSLVRHADTIVFSAACPGQVGQHHVNCQWPEWWQSRFNARGYACDDSVRRVLWGVREVEPWYRQNMFVARKDSDLAGREPRLNAVLHPEMLQFVVGRQAFESCRS